MLQSFVTSGWTNQIFGFTKTESYCDFAARKSSSE
jgi:hypothetical protein